MGGRAIDGEGRIRDERNLRILLSLAGTWAQVSKSMPLPAASSCSFFAGALQKHEHPLGLIVSLPAF